MENPTFCVGVDVGARSTDVWVLASDGRTMSSRQPTSTDLVGGVIAGLRDVARASGMEPDVFCAQVTRFVHTTSWATSALARDGLTSVAVVTTAGFGDTLQIGRMRAADRAASGPAVPRVQVVEVAERVDRDGTVQQELDEDDARAQLEELAGEKVEAVAVCTLWATANPVHELRLEELAREVLPDTPVLVSHRVAPVVGEEMRMRTTAASAALAPGLRAYLDHLADALDRLGVPVPALLLNGLGGVVTGAASAPLPALLLSGHGAAVVDGCRALGEQLGRDDLLVVDAGSVGVDVGLVRGAVPVLRDRVPSPVGDLAVPAVAVHRVAAGGMSRVLVADGMLHVGQAPSGPDHEPGRDARVRTDPSIGSDSDVGPGRGTSSGSRAHAGPGSSSGRDTDTGTGRPVLTVADADALLGVLPGEDADRVRAAVTAQVATPLGMDPVTAAWGVREVFWSHVADQVRLVAAEHRCDPNDLALFVTGDLGPTHAWLVCRELGLPGFTVPAAAGMQAAAGAAAAGRRSAARRPVYLRIQPSAVTTEAVVAVGAALDSATADVSAALAAGPEPTDVRLERRLEVRARGRTRPLPVVLPEGDLTAPVLAELLQRFADEHGASLRGRAAARGPELEVLGVTAVGSGPLSGPRPSEPGEVLEQAGSRPVVYDDPARAVPSRVYTARRPAPGQLVEGPCVIELPAHTVAVPPGWRARSDDFGNLHVRMST